MNTATEFDTLVKIPRHDRTEAQNARVRELAALLAPQPAKATAAKRGPAARVNYVYRSINTAQRAIKAAEKDAIADNGKEAVDGAWSDIVRSVTDLCTPTVRDEILRREGLLGWFE